MISRALLVVLLLSASARAESFKAWAARAAREEREKDDKTAFQSYSSALTEWKPSDGKLAKAKVLCARAAMRDRSGDEAGALADYSACVEIDKKNAKALDRRGELRLKKGDVSSAIDDFYRAIAIDIRFAVAYADRGRAYELQGDKQFAGEDYRRACELGVTAACAKADELAPVRTSAKRNKKKRSRRAATSAAPAPAKPRAARETYNPRFSDCLSAVQACADKGAAFGTCVGRAPACEQKAVKGCCPGACLEAFRKSLNNGASEAAAYRSIFTPNASCAAPPKSDDDD